MKELHTRYPEQKVETQTHTSNLFELVQAVRDSVEPGEEAMVPIIVNHILSSCNATLGTP